MKKILLASTAIVGFAGAAAADVSVTGYAEMGIQGGDGIDAQFFQDVEVFFTMTGETDGGLTFGARIDLDEAPSGITTDDGGVTVFISGDFGTLTMGDTDGAMDWALQDQNIGSPGSLGDEETSHAGWNGSYLDGDGDGQILRYDYSFGDVGFAVSLEQDLTGGQSNNDIGFAIGGKYTLAVAGGSLGFGVAYQEAAGAGDLSAAGISVAYVSDAGFSGVINYVDFDGTGGGTQGISDSFIGLGVAYTTGAITLSANYGEFDLTAGGKVDAFGIAAAYDLGGGAAVHFGYTDDAAGGTVDDERYTLGLAMSF